MKAMSLRRTMRPLASATIAAPDVDALALQVARPGLAWPSVARSTSAGATSGAAAAADAASGCGAGAGAPGSLAVTWKRAPLRQSWPCLHELDGQREAARRFGAGGVEGAPQVGFDAVRAGEGLPRQALLGRVRGDDGHGDPADRQDAGRRRPGGPRR